MFKKFMKPFRNNKGFTLIEFLVVSVLVILALAAIGIGITKAREAGSTNDQGNKFRTISTHLTEYKTTKGSLPLQAANSTTWPAALTPYLPVDYMVGGTYPHGYKCAAAGGGVVTVRSPIMESATIAGNAEKKLVDQGLCDATSTVTAANEIDCILTPFNGNAGCL